VLAAAGTGPQISPVRVNDPAKQIEKGVLLLRREWCEQSILHSKGSRPQPFRHFAAARG
jgi:hypothetical protein